MIIYNLDIVTWYRASYTTRKCGQNRLEILEVRVVGGDRPSSFGLPPVIVNNYMWEMLMYPPNSVWIASFTD
jgi:hypothetical protein